MFKWLMSCFVLSLSMMAFAQGLKKVDYQNKTTETQTSPSNGSDALSGLSPEEQKKLLENIETIKAKQLESQKILEELDKDE